MMEKEEAGQAQNNRWCRMTLGHLGQFHKFHCDFRSHKVLSNYINIRIKFGCLLCIWLSKTHVQFYTGQNFSWNL